MAGELEGKVALVTGASRGIGQAVAAAFAHAGADVMLCSRRRPGLEAARDAILATNPTGGVDVLAVNVGEPDSGAEAVTATIERFGRLDILVNNAATNPYMGPALEIDGPRWAKTLDVNLTAPLMWTQQAHRLWMAEHGGVVINMSSIGGLAVEWLIGNYNVTKAALIHLTKTLAKELAPTVRVNAIAPGLVKTDFARALWESNEAAASEAVPLRRLGEPEDIAAAALFLASDAASWITGHTLVVDGGMLL